ncbi:hypothetical protein OCK02_19190 [Rhizobium sp. TRM96647]|uniref:Multisubunit Na+/H+ antiporter MnhC subunit n=1 Tax=Mycoplana azooxidifex TaxID=1636188 RepID=A0A7W6DDZ8_9HYPH|nr:MULTISPECIES: hypothetical protein [Rhizobiaceae]MBB3978028.1 multisubunit Na+/H+ antiporter MnhC subunit [Mycoplana azooxidifex]MCV3738335.1 hypothetical protein [Rhizobium sp. TRM96647]MCV3759916.1 hypothetical protein [Rhizobium sp. TRM96650]
MENFFALSAIVLGTAVLGFVLAQAMRRQREHQRPHHHDEITPPF